MKISLVFASCLAVTLVANAAFADVVGFEDFDGGAINLSSTTNVFDFGNGGGSGGDVFGRVSPWNGGARNGRSV